MAQNAPTELQTSLNRQADLRSTTPSLLLVLVSLLALTACSTTERHVPRPSTASLERPYRILCVGDSITAGYTDNPTWAVPFQFGYRSPLFELLKSNRISVQFVGSSLEPWDGRWKIPTNTPSPDLRLDNQDHHEGHGAKGTAYVAEHIASWVQTTEPDFVLLMIGINDIAVRSTNAPASAKTNLISIVETIASLRPQTHVIVAQITPYAAPTPAIAEFNKFIRDTLVPGLAGRDKNITTVDQYSNFITGTDATPDRLLFSNAYNHPNAVGYARMARTWFEGIQTIIHSSNSPRPQTASANSKTHRLD